MRWTGRIVTGLWALTALTWAPASGEAADATVTAIGRFVYQKFIGLQSVEIGIKHARVEMCDDDGIFGCQLMAVGETDDDGNFSVTGTAGDFFGDLPDPLVKVIAQSDAATIHDPSLLGGTYCFQSATHFDAQNGSTIDFGTISPSTGVGCTGGGDVSDQNDAWDVHNLAVESRLFMREFTLAHPGRDVPPVTVNWPADHTGYDPPSLFSSTGTINMEYITPPERFFMKQYGSHILQQFAENPVGNFNNGSCDTNVDPFGITTGRCAWHAENGSIPWTEGFPIYLSEVMTRFWGYEGFGTFNIGPGPHPHVDTNFNQVPEVTATILWNLTGYATALGQTVGLDADGDNHDSNNSVDRLNVGFDAVWQAIVDFDPASGDATHNHPRTIGEFWLAFTYFHPDLANRLSAIYDESHITGMLAANLLVNFVDVSPTVVSPGGTLTVKDTTANVGYVSVGESSTTRFYLSSDTVFGSGDIMLGQRTVQNLAAGAGDAGSTNVTVPAAMALGTYYVIACADAPGLIFESDETDNCFASSTKVTIAPPAVAPGAPTGLGQFKTDGTTALPVGAWTNQTSIVIHLTMSDASSTDSLTPQVELKPVTTAFDGTGLTAGSAVASAGSPVQGSVSVTGLSNGIKYHWRARVKDAGGLVSPWVSFGGNAETSADVAVDTAPPTGSIKIDGGATWTDTASASLKLTCSDAKSGCALMQFSNDDTTFTSPEPFKTTRTWTLAAGDAAKTVYVRYIDGAGNVSKSYSDKITLDSAGPVVGAITATPNPFAPALGQTTTIRIPVSDNLSGSCSLQIRILDAASHAVKTMAKTASCPATGATTSVSWDGHNSSGAAVTAGTYTVEVTATDHAGNAGAVGRASVVVQ